MEAERGQRLDPFAKFAVLVFAAIAMCFMFMIASVSFSWWARGHAMSAWVKAKHHVDIPWYQAGTLPIDAKDFSVNVSGMRPEANP